MRGVILALAILVICAAVSYSFEDLTGFFIKAEPTSIVITPDPVQAGSSVTLFINPGRYGAKKYLTIHKYPSNLRKGITNWCSSQGLCLSGKCIQGFKCYGIKSINYRISETWPKGTYYVRVYDYTLKEYVTEPFEVV